MEDYQQAFIERTNQHIGRVRGNAQLLGKDYPTHDADKLAELFEGYSIMKKENPTKEDIAKMDAATLKHITTNPHHPEFWTDSDLTGFTRKNFCPNGLVDATKMPKEALEEMCCDWTAMSQELGTDIYEWFYKVNGKRWKFSEWQQLFILETIEKLQTALNSK